MLERRNAGVVAGLYRRLDRTDPVSLINFAWFAARRGELAVALEAAHQAADHPEATPTARRAVVRLLARQSDGLLLLDQLADRATAASEAPTFTAADDHQAALEEGRLLLSQGLSRECLVALGPLLSHRPPHPEALFLSGIAWAKLRRYGEARKAWETVGQVDPDGPLGSLARRHARSARQLATLFRGS